MYELPSEVTATELIIRDSFQTLHLTGDGRNVQTTFFFPALVIILINQKFVRDLFPHFYYYFNLYNFEQMVRLYVW